MAKLRWETYSRAWYDFIVEKPKLIKSNHTALYMFAVYYSIKHKYKCEFALPVLIAMGATGIKSYEEYIKTLNDLNEWGFIILTRTKYKCNFNVVLLPKNRNTLNTKEIAQNTIKVIKNTN